MINDPNNNEDGLSALDKILAEIDNHQASQTDKVLTSEFVPAIESEEKSIYQAESSKVETSSLPNIASEPEVPIKQMSEIYPNRDKETVLEIEESIENFIAQSNQLKQQKEQNIVIGVGQEALNANQYEKLPTIVLPITEEEEKVGAKQEVSFGLRWLVEITGKIKKIFTGRFTYKTIRAPKTTPSAPEKMVS